MKKDIKVFSTPTCPYCIMLKKFLDQHNINYESIDLSTNPGWMKKVVEKSGEYGVPQMWVNDQVIVGFNVPAIRKALDIKMSF